MDFSTRLDSLLVEDAEVPTLPADHAGTLQIIHRQLVEAKNRVLELEREYASALESMTGELGIQVRKYHPNLNVGLSGGKCSITYRSKDLCLEPNLTKKCWIVSGRDPRFAKTFQHSCGRLPLSMEMDELARLISDFFTQRYRTLQ